MVKGRARIFCKLLKMPLSKVRVECYFSFEGWHYQRQEHNVSLASKDDIIKGKEKDSLATQGVKGKD